MQAKKLKKAKNPPSGSRLIKTNAFYGLLEALPHCLNRSLGFYRILGVLWSKKISFSMPEARSLCDPAEVAHLQLECRQF
jgi:hypothetical protein